MMTNILSNLPSQTFCKHHLLCFPNMPPQYFSFPEEEDELEDGNQTIGHTDVAARKANEIIYQKWVCILFFHTKNRRETVRVKLIIHS